MALLWQELKFKLMVFDNFGSEFEKLFVKVMKAAYPDSFQPSREGGNEGDWGCDGWDAKTKTLYSVYAPFVGKIREKIKAKLAADLKRAREAYPEMRRWRFVSNELRDTHGTVARAIEDLRGKGTFEDLEILPAWSALDLLAICKRLSSERRSEILGVPPWQAIGQVDEQRQRVVRFHKGVPESVINATLASLSQLCNAFPLKSSIDPVSAMIFSGAVMAWWLDKKSLFEEYHDLLDQRAQISGERAEGVALAFLIRCLEICVRQLEMDFQTTMEGALSAEIFGKDLKAVLQFAVDAFEVDPGSQQVWLDVSRGTGYEMSDRLRSKLVIGCAKGVVDLIGITMQSQYPGIFILQDLLISIQRADYRRGPGVYLVELRGDQIDD